MPFKLGVELRETWNCPIGLHVGIELGRSYLLVHILVDLGVQQNSPQQIGSCIWNLPSQVASHGLRTPRSGGHSKPRSRPPPHMRQTSHRLYLVTIYARASKPSLNWVLFFYIKSSNVPLLELEPLATGPVGCTLLHSRAPPFLALQSA
jgi:hypothetical protein